MIKDMDDGKTFLYNAEGTAIGGVFRRPFVDVMESQAATSLAVTGGVGSVRKTNFNYRDVVSFTEASTEVMGSRDTDGGTYNSLVSTTIIGLNIADMVTADRIVARISTTNSAADSETRVSPAGSEFVGLRVAGQPINPELDLPLFSELDTSAKFKDRYKRDKDFKEDMRARFLWGKLEDNAPEFLKARYKWQSDPDALPESKGIMPCSLVKTLGNVSGGLKVYGNVIVVPDFGTIYFAEYHVKESARRLTMMRLQLGSPMEADLTVASGQGNGVLYP